jgi:phosphoglycerate dehydrogenase-like enzyme
LRLTKDFPALHWQIAYSPEEVAAHIDDADVLLLNNRICDAKLGAAIGPAPHRLKWIHFVTSGVERGLAMGLPPGIPVSSASGTNGNVLAEHAMTLLLASMRRFKLIYEGQAAHEWRRRPINQAIRGLEGARVCLIGLGATGRELARKLRAFDADVIAVSRGGTDPNVSRVYDRAQLCVALSCADAVIICTNSDATTHHLIGARELAAFPSGGFLVNMARGEIIDEKALVAALRSGHLAGAGLDVTETEPPKPDDPLWDIPSVILSPHVSGGGSGEASYQRQRQLFAENLRRFTHGEKLRNAVQT